LKWEKVKESLEKKGGLIRRGGQRKESLILITRLRTTKRKGIQLEVMTWHKRYKDETKKREGVQDYCKKEVREKRKGCENEKGKEKRNNNKRKKKRDRVDIEGGSDKRVRHGQKVGHYFLPSKHKA